MSKYLLAIILLFALAIAAPILWHSVCFRLSEVRTQFGKAQHKTVGPVFMEISTQQIYYNITKMFAICHLAFLLFAYPLMCRRIRRMNLKQRSHRVEVRMCYAIILLSIANLLFAIYLITWEILSRGHAELSPIAEWILLMIVDFYDLNSPYGLIITSKIIRKYTLPFCLLMC
ncbi:hypothetical protein niasHS_000341 [Heterodera schachtii]|uniref:Serpentine receptor class gamma n=1 Tax=Heterodera schachtii TaxID=97005 RepID=A0ABD2K5S1_HETSC